MTCVPIAWMAFELAFTQPTLYPCWKTTFESIPNLELFYMNWYSLEFLCSSQGAGGLLTWISLTTQTKVASCNKLISNTQLSMNIQQIYTTHDDLAWEHCTIQGRIKAHLANFDGDVWHIFNEPAQRFLSPSHIWKLRYFFCSTFANSHIFIY